MTNSYNFIKMAPVDGDGTMGTISSRPMSASYSGNIPSKIVDPTPSVTQPVYNAKPTDIASVDVSIPDNTSQINNPVTSAPTSTTVQAKKPSVNYLVIGLVIIAIVVGYYLLKKYKKI